MRVAVLGAGLIGGSVAIGLRSLAGYTLSIFDPDPEARDSIAARIGAEGVMETFEAAVANADLIFACAPVSAIAATVIEASAASPAGCVLTDVGSTKRNVVLEVEKGLAEGRSFIGGHPMAGSEEAGAVAAREDLFAGAHWILTPTERSEGEAYERVHDVVTALGARAVALDPDTHDALMAVVSHLPQLMASTLMAMAVEETTQQPGLLSLAGRGFRDMTRLAASNPRVWLDVCEQNAEQIARALRGMASRLSDLGAGLGGHDLSEAEAVLTAARTQRKALRDKPAAGELVDISVPIPDQPGVLALVTTTIGNLGINIEDIAIVHGVDGARGLLTIAVDGRENAARATEALVSKGLVAEMLAG